ncbi:hypothetical protein ACF8QD_17700 [Aeromonas media]|uniref:hypothetical protein n=1 Tax=Aeromonas media TaxID=651 RepID=UPI00370AE2E0
MSFINKVFLGLRSVFCSLNVMLKFRTIKVMEQLNKDSDYIVSITTFPPRIKHVELTIKSILLQSVKPAKIILYLSDSQFRYEILPNSLKRLEKYGLTIKFVKGDIRSYKKLFYAKAEYPLMHIITADDDVCYPIDWLEKIIDTARKYPDDIIFYRGHLMVDESGIILPYKEMLNKKTDGIKTSLFFLPTGVCGILYPPGSMHSDWSDINKIGKLAPTADDIWFKAMTLLENKKCTRVYDYNVLFPPVLGSQKFSLKKINVDSEGFNNDKQIDMVFTHYGLMRNE